MPNYTAPSSRFVLALTLGATSLALPSCDPFEPESHWECFNPDCEPVDSGISGGGAAARDSGGDGGRSGSSGSGSGAPGGAGASSGTSGGAGTACTDCDPTQVCDQAPGECVECLGNDDCESPTPICTVDHRCVPCTLDRHCASTTPACNDDNTCVGCTDAALHCSGDTPLCEVARHQCVQCLENSDCTDPAASRCSEGTCQPCSGPLHCEHLDGLAVCDTSSGSGECVQCTGTQYGACGTAESGTAYVCDSAHKTCTDRLAGSVLACQPCLSDAQCAAGMACMQTKFGPTATGSYCLWKQDAPGASAPKGDCLNVRPFVGTESAWVSVDGQSTIVCKPRTSTCQGQSDFSGKSCSGAGPTGHADCGTAGVDDSYCASFGPSQHFCTVPCVSHLDCKDTRAGDDMECQPQSLGGQTVNVCQFQ